MKKLGYSLFAACLSLGVGLSAFPRLQTPHSLPSWCRNRRQGPNKARCRTCNIAIIAVTAATGGNDATGGIAIVRAIAVITVMTAAIGVRHRSIATARRRSIAAAIRMFAGAITVIVPIAPTTIRSSPIMGRDASAIHPICDAKTVPNDRHRRVLMGLRPKIR